MCLAVLKLAESWLLSESLLQVPGCIQVGCDPVDLLLLLPQDLEVLLTHPPHLHFLWHNKDQMAKVSNNDSNYLSEDLRSTYTNTAWAIGQLLFTKLLSLFLNEVGTLAL